MNGKLIVRLAFLSVIGLPFVGSGNVARTGMAGKIVLEEVGIELQPRAFLPGWRGIGGFGGDVKDGVVPFGFQFDDIRATGRATFSPLPNGDVLARWRLTVEKPVRVEQLFIGTGNLPVDIWDGGSYVIDGEEKPFPAVGSNFHFGWKKNARSLTLKDKAGRMRMGLAFKSPLSVVFQDNHKFDGGVELRLLVANQNLVPGKPVEWEMEISCGAPMELEIAKPFVVEANETWLPFPVKRGIVKGSALDFSEISGLDAPAGKYGRVVVRDGHFEFSDRPGVARRFYGVNLCFGANYFQTPETADRFAEELARRGYNSVRIHHHDGMLVEKMKDSTTINPRRMRELDALAAAFIRHGIYITTDLYVSRPVPWKEIGEDKPGTIPVSDYKMLVRENEAAYSNLCAFAKNWLTHTNEFTGRSWAAEPGVAWISLVNENCPDNFRPNLDDAGRAAYAEVENRFYARLTKFLREEVGARQLFTDLNGWSLDAIWSSCRTAFDYVDMHFYVDHPRFLEQGWRLPSECKNEIPFAPHSPQGANWAGKCAIPGKPFTITEWNFSAPGNYRGVGGIATGAWAARENWDGLWRFAWSHSVEGVKNPCGQAVGYFDMSGDPLSLAGERASMCLFLRGDLAAGDTAALKIDGRAGTMFLDTPRTAGGFVRSGMIQAGVFSADIGPRVSPATIWASSLDRKPLAQSGRILVTHLTDVQNSGARFADASMRVLLGWGGLPHLMRRGRADVSLALDDGSFAVYVLDADGARRNEIPASYQNGKLSFVADSARDPGVASYLYEIVRRPNAE